VLHRNLKRRPPATDLFGRKGRRWLSTLELPEDERQTVDPSLRHIDFLDLELTLVDRDIAVHLLASEEIRGHGGAAFPLDLPVKQKDAPPFPMGAGFPQVSLRLGDRTV
jgi:hypothetical protein